MTQPPPPTDLDWAELLDFASRLRVKVWRYDKKRDRLVQVASLDDHHDHDVVDDPGTNPSTGSEEGDNE